MEARPHVLPSSNLSYLEIFLYMLDTMDDISYKNNPQLVRPIDALFIFHIEHEMNYSTTTTWQLTSSGFDVYISLTRATRETGGIGALYGPLHWGENVVVLRTLNEISIIDYFWKFVQGVKI